MYMSLPPYYLYKCILCLYILLKLYMAANESGRRAKFITFPSEKKFGHNDIFKAENLPNILRY